jgi:hypothetical protein
MTIETMQSHSIATAISRALISAISHRHKKSSVWGSQLGWIMRTGHTALIVRVSFSAPPRNDPESLVGTGVQ